MINTDKKEDIAYIMSILPDQIDVPELVKKLDKFDGLHCEFCKGIKKYKGISCLNYGIELEDEDIEFLIALKCSQSNCGTYTFIPVDWRLNLIKKPEE